MAKCNLCNEELDEIWDPDLIGPNKGIQHYACFFRSVVGGIGLIVDHEYFCNQEGDPDAGFTYRESALFSWYYYNNNKKLFKPDRAFLERLMKKRNERLEELASSKASEKVESEDSSAYLKEEARLQAQGGKEFEEELCDIIPPKKYWGEEV